jgi:hypothetical protein
MTDPPDPSASPPPTPPGRDAPFERKPDALTRPSIDPTWWQENWKKFFITVAIFTTFAMLSCFGGGLIGSNLSTKRSAQYQQSKAAVEGNAELVGYVGEPMAESWIAWVDIDRNEQGFTRRTILFTLTGPRGKLTVESVGVDRDASDDAEHYTLESMRVHLPESAPPEAGQVVTLRLSSGGPPPR